MLGRPYQRYRTDVIGAVIASDGNRFAAPFDDPVARSDYPLGRQRGINLDPQAFAVVVVDDIEQPTLRPSASWSCMKSIDQL
jgi:hypothetical protein